MMKSANRQHEPQVRHGFPAALKAAVPDGIDIYFENVGGAVFDAVLLGTILRKRMTLRGFIVFDDFGHLYPAFATEMGEWVASGKVHYREEMIDGLERAPAAFVGLLRGEAFGKRVVRLTV